MQLKALIATATDRATDHASVQYNSTWEGAWLLLSADHIRLPGGHTWTGNFYLLNHKEAWSNC